MRELNKKIWDIMCMLIVLILFLSVHVQYREILICQKELEIKVDSLYNNTEKRIVETDLDIINDHVLYYGESPVIPELPVMPSGKVMWEIKYSDGQKR